MMDSAESSQSSQSEREEETEESQTESSDFEEVNDYNSDPKTVRRNLVEALTEESQSSSEEEDTESDAQSEQEDEVSEKEEEAVDIDTATKPPQTKSQAVSKTVVKRPATGGATKKATAVGAAKKVLVSKAPDKDHGSTEQKPSTSGTAKKNKAATDAKAKKVVKIKMPEAKSLTTKDMIVHAVADIKNKKGASVPAIKKQMRDKYDVTDRRMVQVTKLLRVADTEGWLVQVAGVGASSGSHFKLPDDMKKALKKKEEMKDSSAKAAEKEKKPMAKAKEAAKRKMEKKPVDKEVAPAKKKKESDVKAAKKKVTATTSRKKAVA